MILYVIRHGQTEANANHLFNGINEGDLNENGIQQAKELAKIVQTIDIDYIFCSPLKRTIHTANILNVKNKPIYKDNRLIERDCGSYTLKPSKLIQDKSKLYIKNENEYTEFESFDSILNRVESFIKELKEKYTNENILIVTHGDIVFAFQEIFKRKNEEYPKTCELFKFELK